MISHAYHLSTVDDILTLSKLDSQLLLVTPVAAQPLNVVQRVLKMHEGELHSHGIELKFHVDESFSALGIDWVKFDPSRVLQVSSLQRMKEHSLTEPRY